MKSRFVLCTNNSSPKQDELFSELLDEKNLDWWHWLKNTWLIIDNSGKLKASDIRDLAVGTFEKEYLIVIELKGNSDTWSGFGPTSENKNMFKWVQENW